VVQNFNKAGTDWAHGNFGYGASTNFNDLVAVVQNFNKVLPPPSGSGVGLGGGSTPLTAGAAIPLMSGTDVQMPEPCGAVMFAAGVFALLSRRRRKEFSPQSTQRARSRRPAVTGIQSLNRG
jgi:hypothetical protein